MTEDTVQNYRDLVRPFLTVWFSILFGAVVMYALISGKLDVKEAIIAVGAPLGTIIGYHFGKKSTIDRKETSKQ